MSVTKRRHAENTKELDEDGGRRNMANTREISAGMGDREEDCPRLSERGQWRRRGGWVR